MHLVDDGLAQHGQVIWAAYQTSGKGQRGKKWENDSGSLLMSLIVKPTVPADKQFVLSMQVAITIAKYLKTFESQWQVAIKWPNDIYLNDKKACGILIENVFRGMTWAYSVIGIGLNVNQKKFSDELSNATSMAIVSDLQYNLSEIITDIRSGILNLMQQTKESDHHSLLTSYNDFLFRRNKEVHFVERATGRHFDAYIQEVNKDGQLVVLSHMGIESYHFGSLDWVLK